MCLSALIGPKLQTSTETTGDEYIRLHTTRHEYIRVGIMQEMSTYECLEVRRRVHTSAWRSGDEYIRQETSTYKYMSVPKSRRPVHTSR